MFSFITWQGVLGGVLSFVVLFFGIWGLNVIDKRHPGKFDLKIPTPSGHLVKMFWFITGMCLIAFGVWATIVWVKIFPYVIDMLLTILSHYPAWESIISISPCVLLLSGVFLGVSCVVSGIGRMRKCLSWQFT